MSDPAHRFVERMGGALTNAGFPSLPARVFSALLADDDGRMTSAELAAALDVSAAGVSGAIRYLTQVHLVRRERERGSRRDVYVVEDDAWRGAMMSDRGYSPMLAALDAALAEIGEDAPARYRLWLSREFLAFVDHEVRQIAARWEERRAELERATQRETR